MTMTKTKTKTETTRPPIVEKCLREAALALKAAHSTISTTLVLEDMAEGEHVSGWCDLNTEAEFLALEMAETILRPTNVLHLRRATKRTAAALVVVVAGGLAATARHAGMSVDQLLQEAGER